jgi:hypothetical protein
MPIIARFILAADAAVFQTLLEEKGIPSTLLDSGSVSLGIGNIAPAAIDVPDEHVAHALAVYADYSKDKMARAATTERTRRHPFFIVWALITVAIMLFFAGLCLPSIKADADSDTWLLFFGSIFCSGIFFGLIIACVIAFLRMISSAFKRKTDK